MIKNIDGLLEHVEINLRKRMDAAIIGLSGGADSTLVTLLAIKALGRENVFGVHMPYGQLDRESFNTKSIKLANHLGIKHETIEIGSAVDSLINECVDNFDISKLNNGNMRSRMRMVALYTVCCSLRERTGNKVRVLGTGNLSEDFIGYDTKGGDALCDYFPIGALVKSEVYQLLEYFRDNGEITEDMIDRVPSAGLWDGQTDEGELGYTYEQMEPYVINLYNRMVVHKGKTTAINMNDPILKFVLERHIGNKHKHQAPPVLALREFCK